MGRMTTLAEAEAAGAAFAKAAGKDSIAALRAMSPEQILAVPASASSGMNGANVDGWFLPQDLYTAYSQGKQVDVALLTGGTNDEGGNLGRAGGSPASGGRGPAAGTPGAATTGGRAGRGSPTTLAAYAEWARSALATMPGSCLSCIPPGTTLIR